MLVRCLAILKCKFCFVDLKSHVLYLLGVAAFLGGQALAELVGHADVLADFKLLLLQLGLVNSFYV